MYKIGDIVKIKSSFLDEPVNVLGYVYEEYNLAGNRNNDWGWNGVSIITENGVDLGGFSADEQKQYLEFVRKSGYHYSFANVIKLDRDFNTQIKPLFN